MNKTSKAVAAAKAKALAKSGVAPQPEPTTKPAKAPKVAAPQPAQPASDEDATK